jgi:GTP-binding protein
VSGADPATAVGVPRVAVLGRQNVGKSTLVNRLLGRRETIAHETPGVTRDRVELAVEWGGRHFAVVDTGGVHRKPSGIEADVARQAALAAQSAGLVLLVVDVTTGITEEDEALARGLRKAPNPVLVVANKADSEVQEPQAAEFHALGLGEPIAVSALHGRGTGELLDRILDLIPDEGEPQPEDEARFSLVGRPNVGKSSLFNRLVQEERAIVNQEPGTTRDAVDSVVRIDERPIRFIDTAGFRAGRKARGVEYYGVVRSLRAIDSAHVALLVVDASEGLTGEDKRLAARVGEAGRGLVAALNKWDLVPSEERRSRFVELGEAVGLFPGTPVIRTSALTGLGVTGVLPSLLSVHEAWATRVPTASVNRLLEEAQAVHPAPRNAGRILYGTQVGAGPPRFVVFGAGDPGPSYRRYLENAIRKEFGFGGVPIRLSFRARSGRRRSGGVGARQSGRRPRPAR